MAKEKFGNFVDCDSCGRDVFVGLNWRQGKLVYCVNCSGPKELTPMITEMRLGSGIRVSGLVRGSIYPDQSLYGRKLPRFKYRL